MSRIKWWKARVDEFYSELENWEFRHEEDYGWKDMVVKTGQIAEHLEKWSPESEICTVGDTVLLTFPWGKAMRFRRADVGS